MPNIRLLSKLLKRTINDGLYEKTLVELNTCRICFTSSSDDFNISDSFSEDSSVTYDKFLILNHNLWSILHKFLLSKNVLFKLRFTNTYNSNKYIPDMYVYLRKRYFQHSSVSLPSRSLYTKAQLIPDS